MNPHFTVQPFEKYSVVEFKTPPGIAKPLAGITAFQVIREGRRAAEERQRRE